MSSCASRAKNAISLSAVHFQYPIACLFRHALFLSGEGEDRHSAKALTTKLADPTDVLDHDDFKVRDCG